MWLFWLERLEEVVVFKKTRQQKSAKKTKKEKGKNQKNKKLKCKIYYYLSFFKLTKTKEINEEEKEKHFTSTFVSCIL